MGKALQREGMLVVAGSNFKTTAGKIDCRQRKNRDQLGEGS